MMNVDWTTVNTASDVWHIFFTWFSEYHYPYIAGTQRQTNLGELQHDGYFTATLMKLVRTAASAECRAKKDREKALL